MFLVNVEKSLKIFEKVYISSDTEEVIGPAEALGAIPIWRDENLCGDTPNIPVYQHAITHMGNVAGFVAIQANSPNISPTLIRHTLTLMETGDFDEIMTCHPDYSIYGSIWAMKRMRLRKYPDPYNPKPDVLLVDTSIDIHTRNDYKEAQYQCRLTRL